jgi:sec-independent protein translocase protein TatA
MGEFGPWHLLIVAGVFVLLFGAKRLPDAARSLGKSARIMKTELRSIHEDDKPAVAAPVVIVPAETVDAR